MHVYVHPSIYLSISISICLSIYKYVNTSNILQGYIRSMLPSLVVLVGNEQALVSL